MEFHQKVHPAIERILIFRKGDLCGEMKYVTTMEDQIDGIKVRMKIFNGTTEGESVLAYFLGGFGSVEMPFNQVFSKALAEKPENSDSDHVKNAVIVSWNKPTANVTPEEQEKSPDPKVCLLDFPKAISDALEVPEIEMLQKFEIPENIGKEDAAKRGFDSNADGYFVKSIHHKWPENEQAIEALKEEKIKVSLYEHMLLKIISFEA